MPTVQFSLTGSQVEILETFAEQGESLNLTAKRVLITFLLGIPNRGKAERNRAIELDHQDDQLMVDKIEALIIDDDVEKLEASLEEYRSQTIDKLEERIEKLEASLEERIIKLEGEIQKLWIQVKLGDCFFTGGIESIEKRIDKLGTEIETLTTLSKQQTTPNYGEYIIFLADPEETPIQFWTGQFWTDNLDLAYRYKSTQAISRAVDKLKKRKLPEDSVSGTSIAIAPIEKLLNMASREKGLKSSVV